MSVNSLPTTDARSTVARSVRGRRSSRAASSAWIVGGTAGSPFVPSSLAIATICSTKSGLPSAASTTRRLTAAVKWRRERSASISRSDSASERDSRRIDVALSLPPAQVGRESSSSGRATVSSSIGASRVQSATCSTRSRNVGSAQCRSSSTTTSGRSRATRSRSVRVAQAISSAMPAPSRVIRSCSSSASVSSSRRRTSISGQYVMPSPYGRQRPSRIVASPSARSRNSRTRRDLPIPAVPRMVNRYGVRSRTARSNACQSWESSFSRPTIGASGRRVNGSAPATTSSRRRAATGSLLPFAATDGTGSARTASRTKPNVESPSRISPGAAACSSRAAVLTASPTAIVCPSPATTSPVFTPVRASIRRPKSRSSSSLRPASASRISAAARTARSASSSCSVGIPKTAMTASPMYFSTVPPCRSIGPLIAS